MAKTTALVEETCQLAKAEKERTNLVTKLAALREQMKKAKAKDVAGFRTSQPYFDACSAYYGDRFDN